MIDKINNASNDANLEILGIRSDSDPGRCISEILRLAGVAPPERKTGYQFSLREDSPLDERELGAQGLRLFYSTYDMR